MTVRVERRKDYLIMTLDRPQALNALNYEMIQILSHSIGEIESDPTFKGGILVSSSPRAYCAGGDIKLARENAMAQKISDAMIFFHAEYDLNRQMHHCTKPLVAVIDGVTMGGGVGISASCRYRLATTKTMWAMPEVGIGFFPDVGAAYYLARMADDFGLYLGMTGSRVNDAGELLWAGIATNIIEFNDINDVVERLIQSTNLDHYISELSLNIAPKRPEPWAFLYEPSYCPLSVRVAEQHITRARTESFDEVIARDLCLAEKFMAEPDFIEGVRAMVVDKDKNPKWSKTMEELNNFSLDSYLN